MKKRIKNYILRTSMIKSRIEDDGQESYWGETVSKKHKKTTLEYPLEANSNESNYHETLIQIIKDQLKYLKRGEKEFEVIGKFYGYAREFNEQAELSNTLSILTTCTEFQSLIYFEAICLLKPIISKESTNLRNIVYLKYAGMLADSWYDSLEFYFDKEFINSLNSIPKFTHLKLRKELKRSFKSRKEFKKQFKTIRNSVVAHRRVSIMEHLESDDKVNSDEFIFCLIDFLARITNLEAELLSLCAYTSKLLTGIDDPKVLFNFKRNRKRNSPDQPEFKFG